MNSLVKYLVEQVKGKTIAVYGGGFKPPTKGHFGVVKQALEQNPSITEFRVYVGTGERDGITQSQSVLIWEIYSKYLPFKVDIVPSKAAPIKAIYDTAKENPQDEVLWVIGAREGNEEDFSDIAKRTTSLNKYPNLELRTIISKDGTSGTAARNALQQDPESIFQFLPDVLSDQEKREIVSILSPSPINELLEQDDILSLEVVNPDGETFKIKENNIKGLYTYEDSMGNLYFARITFQPVDVPYFEFKVGWFEDNDIQKPKYEPQLPSNTTSRDDLKRRNTVAKIYRDKILPFFKENQNLSNKLIVIPMSNSRHIFSQRLLLRHTPNEFRVDQNPTDLVVSLKKNINEKYILKNLEKEFPIELQLYDKGTHLELDKILVKYKKEGIGTKVMKKIIDYANKSEQPIYLTPSTSYGGSSVSRLEKFYKKLGFEPNKDKNISNLKMVKYPLNEGAESINYKQKIIELTKHMIDQGKNIQPLPKVVFKNDEAEANDFFGKTAYYQPSTQTIVLYVKDRHPKDIVRSYAHEMIHHIQNLEDRLGVISTTDTNEDGDLDKIEREAYLDGNMTFRNWTDTFVGDQMSESPFTKDVEENIISDLREYGQLPEYKIDLNDVYDYKTSEGFFEFEDNTNGVKVIVKVKSLPKDIVEFKFYPIKGEKILGFTKLPKPSPKIMNTIFKIFIDEVLPKHNKILVQPSDYTRYRLFRAMLNNNLSKKEYKIDTNDNPIGQSSLLVQKSQLGEKKDPFGLTAYARELALLRENEDPYRQKFINYLKNYINE